MLRLASADARAFLRFAQFGSFSAHGAVHRFDAGCRARGDGGERAGLSGAGRRDRGRLLAGGSSVAGEPRAGFRTARRIDDPGVQRLDGWRILRSHPADCCTAAAARGTDQLATAVGAAGLGGIRQLAGRRTARGAGRPNRDRVGCGRGIHRRRRSALDRQAAGRLWATRRSRSDQDPSRAVPDPLPGRARGSSDPGSGAHHQVSESFLDSVGSRGRFVGVGLRDARQRGGSDARQRPGLLRGHGGGGRCRPGGVVDHRQRRPRLVPGPAAQRSGRALGRSSTGAGRGERGHLPRWRRDNPGCPGGRRPAGDGAAVRPGSAHQRGPGRGGGGRRECRPRAGCDQTRVCRPSCKTNRFARGRARWPRSYAASTAPTTPSTCSLPMG